MTRVLLSFLSSTLLRIHNNLVSKHLRGKPAVLDLAGTTDSGFLEVLPADTSGVVTSCMRRDAACALDEALQSMSEEDRQILVLRGIEQLPYKVLAANLEVSEGALTMRYRRALDRLCGHLPAGVLEEMRD